MSAYKYKLITPDIVQEALQFYIEHYLPNDPLLKAVRCTELTDIDRHLTLSYLQQGLSWCAVNEVTGKLVGIKINRSVSMADLPDVKPTLDDYVRSGWLRKQSSVLGLFDLAFDTKQILTTYKEETLMRLFAFCVHPDHQKRGVATELMKQGLDYSAQHGIPLFGVLCTSAYTKQICENQGFDKVKEINYATYVDDLTSSLLFKDVEEPHKAATCYVKRL